MIEDENDPNAYGRVEKVYPESGMVAVSNMNMPFQGTFAHVLFTPYEVMVVKR